MFYLIDEVLSMYKSYCSKVHVLYLISMRQETGDLHMLLLA